ncbi:MAG TPA: phenylalanine--tRNA ligase subunit beta, partial [Candidatus Lustribacter sp.]|nr:phenylalanine--tRNA ligase subunit beta [Candidatus Lustribacter sp.]
MKVPISWLRDYVRLPHDADAIVTRLATLGFPVDAVESRPAITGVVVGRIAKIEKHPNADRLFVCTVDVGTDKTLTIATAATNVAAGQVIPVATIGAKLPQLTIEPRKMRGIASEGMLCSPDELALEPEWFEDGIMQLDRDMALGTNVVDLLGLADPVLDVDVTPNRVDALSMLGLARELAAAFEVPLRGPALTVATSGETDDVRVTLESVDARRYVTQRVGGLTVRTAPVWMRVRLALAGQRPINNLVDISNFVMLETGQPLHFFDYEKIAGAHIIVRDAKPGEHLTTLDGVDRALDQTALVIADEAQATGLAGLMGGRISEVSATTREIVIESANWTGPRIRRMSVKLGLRSEASTRNEKNLPPALSDIGAARAAVLLAAEGGTVRAPKPFGQPLTAPATVALPKNDVLRLLGFALEDGAVVRALTSLGFGVEDRGLTFAVTAPPWRSDIAIPADIVEEIARVVGYDRLEGAMPSVGVQPLSSAVFDRDNEIATTLAGLGYRECMTLALQPAAIAERDRALGFEIPAVAEIINPLSDDQRYMRYAMIHAHLAMVARDRLRPYRTFEIGHIFADAQPHPTERNVALLVAATARIDEPAWRSTPYAALLADVLAA